MQNTKTLNGSDYSLSKKELEIVTKNEGRSCDDDEIELAVIIKNKKAGPDLEDKRILDLVAAIFVGGLFS